MKYKFIDSQKNSYRPTTLLRLEEVSIIGNYEWPLTRSSNRIIEETNLARGSSAKNLVVIHMQVLCKVCL